MEPHTHVLIDVQQFQSALARLEQIPVAYAAIHPVFVGLTQNVRVLTAADVARLSVAGTPMPETGANAPG